MSRRAAVIVLSDAERRVLEARVRAATTPQRDLLRARIVLGAERGATNVEIAAGEGVHPDTVAKWRNRFAVSGLDGLGDAARSGRPKVFTDVQVAEVKALACTPPSEHGVPLARWSASELARHAICAEILAAVSPATVTRWLATDAIKPWQHRSWIFVRDPDFAVKAARVLDLYDRTWNGQPLGPNDYVISADEKSQLQALRRRHGTRPAGPGHPQHVEFEYQRAGTVAYFAAYDVHHAQVIGRIEPKTGIDPFSRLVEQVMTTEPYASADNVYWIVDNGSSHAGQRSIDRMHAAHPTAHLVHLPIHASWLNQVEIYFSILQRKAISPADFADLDALAERVLAFQAHYNQKAKPFAWNYTRVDLLRDAAQYNLAA
jgi:transposase